MTFEEAQEYISRRGFDIPWNDCDVFVDERYITQTVANVLKWADDNPDKYTSNTDAFIEKACEFFAPYIPDNSGGYERAAVIEAFKNYIKEE
jgi:hypothetical protein